MINQTLLSTPLRQPVQLERINAGGRLAHRLTELGLTPGVELSIIQDNGGPLLISVRGSRIAIGRGMAQKIQVRSINENISIQNQPLEMAQMVKLHPDYWNTAK